jgi:hypothetical protein
MNSVTQELHHAFLQPLGIAAVSHSSLDAKPFTVDLALPLPPRLRVYMYTLVGGGVNRRHEYKAVLRVPGQEVGAYGSFDHSGDRLALLVAYREDLDVFVLWDASLHAKFKNGGNIQVRDATVHRAAALGRSDQVRVLSTGVRELVIACQSTHLAEAIDDRVASTGGVAEGEWTASVN